VRRPSWLTVALAGAGGFFVGVLLMILLGGPKDAPTKTVTTVARSITNGVGVVVKVRVPNVVGLSLPDARDRLEAAGFDVKVDGLGVAGWFGQVFEGDFHVTSQSPGPTVFLIKGKPVTVQVEGT
jgi:beta-lactam-binding protein with PASTA domain